MHRPAILIAESAGFSPQALADLREVGDVTAADLDRKGLLSAVRDADVLWVRLRNQIDAEVLDASAHLRFVVSPTTGLNHIDLAHAEKRGIRVLSLRGETEFLKDIRATAEHTVGLMLALLRHIPGATQHVLDGGWDRDRFRGRELHGKTAGIVGYGRLGRIVARYLQAFDMRVLAADPHANPEDVADGVEMTDLDALLPQCHIVSLHVNLCPETAGLFGQKQFDVMQPGAWFINTARGELIDEDALLGALRSGRLGGAALDVLAMEANHCGAKHPLVKYAREHNNLIMTPHIGGATAESMARTEEYMARQLCASLGHPV